MAGDWLRRAACRDESPELFFPVAVRGPVYEAQVAAAKRVCAGCPVRIECLTFASDAMPYGIAGGLTEQERPATRPADRSDWVVVDRLIRSGRIPGASNADIAQAAVRMVRAGGSINAVAVHLGVRHAFVARWVARAAAGQPLNRHAKTA